MPYALIFFIMVKLIVYLLQDEEKPLPKNRLHGVQYLVNGKKIEVSHMQHCRTLLGIGHNEVLSDTSIKQAYYQVHEEVAQLRRSTAVVIDVAELRAAKCYLMDRWACLAFKN